MRADAHPLYDPDLSLPMAWVIVLGLGLLWVGLHWGGRYLKSPWWRPLAFLVRLAAGGCFLWGLFQVLGNYWHFATPWSLALIAWLGAGSIEIIAELYRGDRRIAGSRMAPCLIAARVLAVGVILTMLLEPIAQRTIERHWDREVIVMIDDSQSMDLVDEQLDPTYAFDIAETRRQLDSSRHPTWKVWRAVNRWGSLIFSEWAEKETLAQARQELSLLVAEAASPAVQEVLHPLLDRETPPLAGTWREANRRLYAWSLTDDQEAWNHLDSRSRQAMTTKGQDPRAQIAASVLRENGFVRTEPLLEALDDRFTIRVFRFGNGVRELNNWKSWDGVRTSGEEDPVLRARTDFAQALEHGLAVSSDRTLAGMVLVSDGRHNARRGWEEAARAYGARRVPIGALALGTRHSPRDGAITDVHAASRVTLGASVDVEIDTYLLGLASQQINLRLHADDKVIDTQTILVKEDEERRTLRFAHVPAAIGEVRYRAELEAARGERVLENNQSEVTVRVDEVPPEPELPEEGEEETVEVLLVDGFPRWEFRYLRNLLDGRDRSVGLQYVLIRPERIEGFPSLSGRPANARWPFGQSMATEVPARPEDWLAFDVIILGDLPPDTLTDNDWKAIEQAVSKEGALLIFQAGRHAMPHRFTNETMHRLLPVRMSTESGGAKASNEIYRVRWTPDGEESRLLEVAPDSAASREVWETTQPFTWRYVAQPRRTAKVLAYAVTPQDLAANSDPDKLAKTNPLILSQRLGAGRVVFFAFDSTWRLRYGADDRYHHRFWWQLLHWKVDPDEEEELLNKPKIQVATDQEIYALSDPVHVKAKVTGTDQAPVASLDLRVVMMHEGKALFSQSLQARAGSPGVYEAVLSQSLPEAGVYELVLHGDAIFQSLLKESELEAVTTTFTAQPDASIELSHLTADYDAMQEIAALSGGRFVTLPEAETLPEIFGPSRLTDRRVEETTLWDTYHLLLIFVSLLTFEWVLRRKAGLT